MSTDMRQLNNSFICSVRLNCTVCCFQDLARLIYEATDVPQILEVSKQESEAASGCYDNAYYQFVSHIKKDKNEV